MGFKGKICEGKDWGEKGRVKLKPAADRFSLLTELPSHGIIKNAQLLNCLKVIGGLAYEG